jgi:hypothetical protein
VLRTQNILRTPNAWCRRFRWLEAFLRFHSGVARQRRSKQDWNRPDRESYPTRPYSTPPQAEVPWRVTPSTAGKRKCDEPSTFAAALLRLFARTCIERQTYPPVRVDDYSADNTCSPRTSPVFLVVLESCLPRAATRKCVKRFRPSEPTCALGRSVGMVHAECR